MRERLRRAIEIKELSLKEVSEKARLVGTYVYDFLKRGTGKFENRQKVAVALGLRWVWHTAKVTSGAPTSLSPQLINCPFSQFSKRFWRIISERTRP